MAAIIQRPTPPNEWLYQDQEDGIRIFSDCVIRPQDSPAWAECTQAEREKWEEEHKPEQEPENA